MIKTRRWRDDIQIFVVIVTYIVCVGKMHEIYYIWFIIGDDVHIREFNFIRYWPSSSIHYILSPLG